MKRTTEASLSRINMSEKKTIYVEGIIDKRMVECILVHRGLSSAVVIQVDKVQECNFEFGAKSAIKNLIKAANSRKDVDRKYLGIVDSDYEFFSGAFDVIPNLLYTDYNSMESFLIDIDVINSFINEHAASNVEASDFEFYLSRFKPFCMLFYFQVSKIQSLEDGEKICFQNLSLSNEYYVNFRSKRINISNILESKVSMPESCKAKYLNFFWETNRSQLRSNTLHFLHGKYFIRYLISILKRTYNSIKHYNETTIINILKDKYILLSKFEQSYLFSHVINFAEHD